MVDTLRDTFNGHYRIGQGIGNGFKGNRFGFINIGWFDWHCVVEYSIMWD